VRTANQTIESTPVISTSSLGLLGDDVEKTRNEVSGVVLAHNGQIADERSVSANNQTGELSNARLILRVPSSDLRQP
jgi:hypothetical protein